MMSISAYKTADGIVSHRKTQEMMIQDQEDQEVKEELPDFVSLQFCSFNLSDPILQIQMMNMLMTIKKAIHSKYLYVSYRLLQVKILYGFLFFFCINLYGFLIGKIKSQFYIPTRVTSIFGQE